MKTITSSVKDKILLFLVDNCKVEQLSQGETQQLLSSLEIDFDTFYAVMNQFERFGLISDLNLRHSHSSFVLLVEAHDLKEKGGFTIQEEIFQANFNKLLAEIEALKENSSPLQLDKLSKMSSIVSALLAGLTILKK